MTGSVVEQCVALLATQLGVDAGDIQVVRVEEVTWRDGSIGCPRPGHMYTQALVPGQLVELTVNGTTYEFHQGGNQPPFYCPNPTEPLPS